ncbi:MAG: SIS domain-containing protein, partial [Candidatus Dadabacteria bacterium]
LRSARERESTVFIFGNGGSAAAASHFATDLAKDRFGDKRYLFKVMSLVDNTPLITATANDYGYEEIFLRQLKLYLKPDDLVIAISSSGNSENVIRATSFARESGAKTWGIVGFSGGKLAETAEQSVYIPTSVGQYGFMEDVTSILIHMVTVHIYEQDRKILSAENSRTEETIQPCSEKQY